MKRSTLKSLASAWPSSYSTAARHTRKNCNPRTFSAATRAQAQSTSRWAFSTLIRPVLQWSEEFVKSKASVVVAAGAGLVAANWAASTGYNRYYKQRVLESLARGVMPDPEPPALLPRDALRTEIKDLMQSPTRFFPIILGPPGSGKSTSVRAACREMGGGVGFFEVHPCVQDFGQDLGQAFNFKLEKHANLFNIVTQAVVGRKTVELGGNGSLASLKRSCDALHDAAVLFRQATGRPFVLVIDSVDRLVGKKEELSAFVQYSKNWAEDGTISVVFVVDREETAHALWGEHPSQSRAAAPLVVGDPTHEEALLLLKKLGVDEKAAPQCVDLVGTSLLLLERIAGLLHGGMAFAGAQARLVQLMMLEYESIGLLGDPLSDENVSAAAKALLSSSKGFLTLAEWKKTARDSDARRKLIDGGVVRCEDGAKVAFSSKLARLCAAELLEQQENE